MLLLLIALVPLSVAGNILYYEKFIRRNVRQTDITKVYPEFLVWKKYSGKR